MSHNKKSRARWEVCNIFNSVSMACLRFGDIIIRALYIILFVFNCFFCMTGDYLGILGFIVGDTESTEPEKGNTSQLWCGGWGATNICKWGVVGKETITHSLCWIWGTDVSEERGTESTEQTRGEKFPKKERLAIVRLLIMWSEDDIV